MKKFKGIILILVISMFSMLNAGAISGNVSALDATLDVGIAYVDIIDADMFAATGDLRPINTISTDQDGNYEFAGLTNGNYMLQAYDDLGEFISQFYDNVEGPESATILAVSDTTPVLTGIDFLLVLAGEPPVGTGSLSGVVSSDALPIELAQVMLYEVWGDYQYFAMTDSEGEYDISGILPGTYFLNVQAEGFDDYYYDATEIIFEDSTVLTINAELIPGGSSAISSISGSISPVDGRSQFYVEVYESDVVFDNGYIPEPVAFAMSNLEGDYQVNLEVGSYILLANDMYGQYLPEFYDNVQNSTDATVIDIVTDSTYVTGIDFILDNGIPTGNGIIAGTVTSEDAVVVPYAFVILYPSNPDDYDYSYPYFAETDENGMYSIEEVAAGDYILNVHAYYYFNYFHNGASTWEEAEIITIVDSTDLTIDAVLTPYSYEMYQISGVVKDAATGDPIEGAYVSSDYYYNSNPGVIVPNFAVTNHLGEYTLETWSGDHILSAFTSNDVDFYMEQFYDHKDSPMEADILTVEADVSGINFDLTKFDETAYSITGSITDEDGNIPEFGVMLVAISSDEDWESTVPMEEDGSYCLNNLPNNNYYILALSGYAAPTYYERYIDWNEATPVSVGSTDINISLLPIESIGFYNLSGNVTDDSFQPIANTMIYAIDSFGTIKGYAKTDDSGLYNIANLTSGDYSLLATKVGYDSDNIGKIISGNDTQDFSVKATTSISDGNTPLSVELLQNYPNPFNPTTAISFSIANDNIVKLNVYNANGQLVEQLINNQLVKGHHTVNFNAESLNSGIYFYTLEANGMKLKNKMLLIK